MDHCVYIHRRKDDRRIFYVGAGSASQKRPYKMRGRNPHWHNVVKKHDYIVEIWSYWPSLGEALKEEIKLIAFFKSVGEPLTNKTDGGEGKLNVVVSAETRAKLSKAGKNRPALHLRAALEVEFLDGRKIMYPSISAAAEDLKVSRRLIRFWQIGKAKSEYKGIKSVHKV